MLYNHNASLVFLVTVETHIGTAYLFSDGLPLIRNVVEMPQSTPPESHQMQESVLILI